MADQFISSPEHSGDYSFDDIESAMKSSSSNECEDEYQNKCDDEYEDVCEDVCDNINNSKPEITVYGNNSSKLTENNDNSISLVDIDSNDVRSDMNLPESSHKSVIPKSSDSICNSIDCLTLENRIENSNPQDEYDCNLKENLLLNFESELSHNRVDSMSTLSSGEVNCSEEESKNNMCNFDAQSHQQLTSNLINSLPTITTTITASNHTNSIMSKDASKSSISSTPPSPQSFTVEKLAILQNILHDNILDSQYSVFESH